MDLRGVLTVQIWILMLDDHVSVIVSDINLARLMRIVIEGNI